MDYKTINLIENVDFIVEAVLLMQMVNAPDAEQHIRRGIAIHLTV